MAALQASDAAVVMRKLVLINAIQFKLSVHIKMQS
eukprot:XP_001707818.1 Hypothetical protein GL50803_24135 [Giardia lamblia ATCC 50803]